jgi:hypothetical protein
MKLLNCMPTGSVQALLFVFMVSNAEAEIKDYQMRRLVTYQTVCNLDELVKRPMANGAIDFLVACQNKMSYPDGLLISCHDADDISSCEAKTEPLNIELKLLQ